MASRRTLVLGRDETSDQDVVDASSSHHWDRIAAFLDKYAWVEPHYTSDEAWFVSVKHRKSRVVFNAIIERLASGQLASLTLRSCDPSDLFDTSNDDMFLKFERTCSDPHGVKCTIENLAENPSHGVPRAEDALSLAVAIFQHFGASRIMAQDQYSVRTFCNGDRRMYRRNKPMFIPLNWLNILTKGSSWYEARGFQCVEGTVDPVGHAAKVSALRIVPMEQLIDSLTEADTVLRRAVLERVDAGESGESKEDVSRIFEVLKRLSEFLDLVADLRARDMLRRTVSATILEVMRHECTLAAQFVDVLMSFELQTMHERFGEHLSLPDRPAEESWRYVWALPSNWVLDMTHDIVDDERNASSRVTASLDRHAVKSNGMLELHVKPKKNAPPIAFSIFTTKGTDGTVTSMSMFSTTNGSNVAGRGRNTAGRGGISLSWNNMDDALNIRYMGPKQDHNIATIDSAMATIMSVARLFGMGTITVGRAYHATKVSTYQGAQRQVSMQTFYMLTRGVGFLEACGFRSIEEELDPEAFNRHVRNIHNFTMSDLIETLQARDIGLRGALFNGHEIIARTNTDARATSRPLVLNEVVMLIKYGSKILDIISNKRTSCARP